MSDPETSVDPVETNAAASAAYHPPGRSWRSTAGMIVRFLQVRLRFVLVLLAGTVIIGQWASIRNMWDHASGRLLGTKGGESGVSVDTEFFCPMDPGVISDWPSICPVCNMALVRRKKGDAGLLPEGVVARMQLSPYRIQLAGIRTSIVSPRPLAREIALSGVLQPMAEPADAPGKSPGVEFESEVFDADMPFLHDGKEVAVRTDAYPQQSFTGVVDRATMSTAKSLRRPRVRIRILTQGDMLVPGLFVRSNVQVPLSEVEPYKSLSAKAQSGGILAVPEAAVVDDGRTRVVYVETMPGMFDGVTVTLGARCGDLFPVLSGLTAGQRVATMGAFLIDAEAHLNPHLAAGYFGATRSADAAPKPTPAPVAAPSASKKQAAPVLSKADQLLADRQKVCPVTDLPLNSMGGPLAVTVDGKKVFICCKGCERPLKANPQKYLAKLAPASSPASSAK